MRCQRHLFELEADDGSWGLVSFVININSVTCCHQRRPFIWLALHSEDKAIRLNGVLLDSSLVPNLIDGSFVEMIEVWVLWYRIRVVLPPQESAPCCHKVHGNAKHLVALPAEGQLCQFLITAEYTIEINSSNRTPRQRFDLQWEALNVLWRSQNFNM